MPTQQLGRRDTYTPRDDAPVPASVAAWLNSSERVGAVPRSFKNRPNNSKEHLTGMSGAGAEVETLRHKSRLLYNKGGEGRTALNREVSSPMDDEGVKNENG